MSFFHLLGVPLELLDHDICSLKFIVAFFKVLVVLVQFGLENIACSVKYAFDGVLVVHLLFCGQDFLLREAKV
jgi:hypothetical protein